MSGTGHRTIRGTICYTSKKPERLDQERGRLARVGFLTNQPRTIGFQATVDF